jgi:hypothetical protein
LKSSKERSPKKKQYPRKYLDAQDRWQPQGGSPAQAEQERHRASPSPPERGLVS